MMKATRVISAITGFVVFFLAACAFILSYDALRQVALAAGVAPALSYLWPLSLDAFMIAACLSSLRASLLAERAWLSWSLIAAFTALSVAFNVSHIVPLLPSWLVFAIPPAVVFLSLELLTGQLRNSILRNNAAMSLNAINEAIERAHKELAEIEEQADKAEKKPTLEYSWPTEEVAKQKGFRITLASRPHQLGKTREAILLFYRHSPTASYADAARAIGVSRQHVSQVVNAMIKDGTVHKNGNGIEVLV